MSPEVTRRLTRAHYLMRVNLALLRLPYAIAGRFVDYSAEQAWADLRAAVIMAEANWRTL